MNSLFKPKKKILCSSVAALCVSLSGGANAAELEEVVVTAQKRAQNLQEVPISISAMTAEQMDKLALTNSKDLALHTPGLNIVAGSAYTKTELFMRGVGVDEFAATGNNAVAVYNDGVAFGASFGTTAFMFDMERAEVLRGPQGTLWGKNTTGGLINFVHKQPEVGGEVNGFVDLSLAEFDEVILTGAIGFPISDTLAARVAVQRNQREGAYENINPAAKDDKVGGWEANAFRGQLVWEPNGAFRARFSVSHAKVDGERIPSETVDLPEFAEVDGGFLFGNGISFNGETVPFAPDPHETAAAFEERDDFELTMGAIYVDYDMDWATLTSITAVQESDRQGNVDTDGEPSALLQSNNDDSFEGFSQELRLASNNEDGLNWVVGLYYSDDELNYFRANYLNALFVPGGLFPIVNSSRGYGATVESTTMAAFGEVTFDVTDKITLIAGLRFTEDEREVSDSFSGRIFPPNTPLEGRFISQDLWEATAASDPGSAIPYFYRDHKVDESFSEPSARLSLSYQLSEDVNLWFTYSRGFRGGDFNGNASSLGAAIITGAEIADTYEAGFKSDLIDGTLRLNASAYYYDYQDKILVAEIPDPAQGGTVSAISNAATLEIYGADLELSWVPTDNWRIDFNAAYIDAEYTHVDPSVPDIEEGFTPANSPELSFSVLVNYNWALASGGTFDIQVNTSWQDDIFMTDINRVTEFQESYWMTGASIGYRSPEDTWSARLWVKNLNDEDYIAETFQFIGEAFRQYGDPRQVGLSLSYKF